MENIPVYNIIRSRRKTLTLQISSDATLTIRAPLFVSMRHIEKLITEKIHWIQKKQKEAQEKYVKISKKEYRDDETFLYLGKEYPLKIVNKQNTSLVFQEGFFLKRNAVEKGKKVFTHWYKEKAREKITERVSLYAHKERFRFKSIRISSAHTRWGSCGSHGNLNFNWRLLMAPLSVIDYVVVHELAHLVHKNHSKKFWDYVEILMPGYIKEKQWLKDHGYMLQI